MPWLKSCVEFIISITLLNKFNTEYSFKDRFISLQLTCTSFPMNDKNFYINSQRMKSLQTIAKVLRDK